MFVNEYCPHCYCNELGCECIYFDEYSDSDDGNGGVGGNANTTVKKDGETPSFIKEDLFVYDTQNIGISLLAQPNVRTAY
jgi:hypothetical protein